MSSVQEETKILHVTFDMRIGGTEMVIKNIVEGNQNPVHEMSIFCIEEPIGPWGMALESNGVAVSSVARKEGFDIKVIQKLREHLVREDIDVLHCHQYTPWVYGVLASLGLGKKVIFTEHGRFYPDSSSWKRRFINPLLARFTFRITAISAATRQALKDFEFLDKCDISVVYNGIEALQHAPNSTNDIREQLKISKEDIVFGTIARLDPIKNHHLMIRAFSRLQSLHPKTKLIIVGDGDMMSELLELRNSLGLQESIIFTGYISYPKDYLATFDIFLLSSLSEGTSMTLLEAMSLNKPCVVTDAGGNKEIVEHLKTGIVTPNDDETAFATAIQELAENPSRAVDYGANGYVRFKQCFEVSTMSKRYSDLYSAT